MHPATAAAAEVRRRLLAEHGWTSRQVSVRTHRYSLESSIRVVVHDPDVPLAAVQAIAGGAERISRDEATGAILRWTPSAPGGNTYVSVSYGLEALAAFSQGGKP